jgi:hypothetical protein
VEVCWESFLDDIDAIFGGSGDGGGLGGERRISVRNEKVCEYVSVCVCV